MKSRGLIVFFFIICLFSSCTVTQSIDLSGNTGSSDLVANDFLVSVLDDLSCWNGEENDNAFLEVAVKSAAANFVSSDSTTYVYINNKGENNYEIVYGFTSFEEFVNSLCGNKDQNIITKSSDNGTTKISFNLSMENYEQLKEMIPLLADPNFEAYGPVYNNPPYDFRTEDDYLYMMEFIFGEGARTIADSTISVKISTPSGIISTTGSRVSDTDTIFEFRLIDFLLLHEPITFSCTY